MAYNGCFGYVTFYKICVVCSLQITSNQQVSDFLHNIFQRSAELLLLLVKITWYVEKLCKKQHKYTIYQHNEVYSVGFPGHCNFVKYPCFVILWYFFAPFYSSAFSFENQSVSRLQKDSSSESASKIQFSYALLLLSSCFMTSRRDVICRVGFVFWSSM